MLFLSGMKRHGKSREPISSGSHTQAASKRNERKLEKKNFALLSSK